MSKYDSMKIWKRSTAKTAKICQICKIMINAGENYYRGALTDPKINFIGKKICVNCHNKQAKYKVEELIEKN